MTLKKSPFHADTIVRTSRTTKARQKFLESTNDHFIQEDDHASWEKLRVTPWFDKQKNNQRPLYKNFGGTLENNLGSDDVTWEEFDKNCYRNSTKSYKGIIGHYFTNKSGMHKHPSELVN